MMRLAFVVLATCLMCRGQVVQARPKPSDYPVHANAGQVGIGAEYLVHSLAAQGKTFFVPDYLVVEVAVFPAGIKMLLSSGQFTLRLNGKRMLMPQTPGIVAASLKYPDWEQRPTLVADAGVGNAGVTIGQPPAVERFPGDPRPQQRRLPAPPRVPQPDHGQPVLRLFRFQGQNKGPEVD